MNRKIPLAPKGDKRKERGDGRLKIAAPSAVAVITSRLYDNDDEPSQVSEDDAISLNEN